MAGSAYTRVADQQVKDLAVGADEHELVVSIGGAGTFDGVFITGIVAVLLASLLSVSEREGCGARPAPPPRR